MKELTEKENLPQKITVNKVDVSYETKIAHEFNQFFTNVGKNLANKILYASAPFKLFVNLRFCYGNQIGFNNELKNAFCSLKSNKNQARTILVIIYLKM